ncbi:hypothetical protein HYD27_10100, partial [Paenibacillus sp. S150]|nr:hypothetical protein [Paenibacillus sp. S150]
MKRKPIITKLVLIFLALCLLTPEYAVNVLAAPDTEQAAAAAKSGANQTELVQPSPAPGNLGDVQKGQGQPTPTPTPAPDPYATPGPGESPSALRDGDRVQSWESPLLTATEAAYAGEAALDPWTETMKQVKAKYLLTTMDQSLQGDPILTEEQVRALLMKGASYADVYELAFLSREVSREPLALLELKQQGAYTWDELRAQLSPAQANVTDEVYGEDSANGDISKTRSSSARSLVTGSVYEELPVEAGESLAVTAAYALDAVVNSVIEDDDTMRVINQTAKVQYSDRNGDSELIDPASGALTWKSNQISLPGRDGLDLNIGVMYNSNLSSPTTPGPNGREYYNYYNNRFELGNGWTFRFPSLEYQKGFYYHDGEGARYSLQYDSTKPLEEYTHLAGYKGKDKRMLYGGNFRSGNYTSERYIEYSDQRREYFGGADSNYSLLGMSDRYGNTITFHYTPRKIYTGDTYLILSSITDSVGR